MKIFYILLFCYSNLAAQQVAFLKLFKTAPNIVEEAYSMQEVKGTCNEITNTGYILVNNHFSLIRTDLMGNIIWSKQYNYSTNGFSDYVEETNDCGFIVAGSVYDSSHNRNYNLIKTDKNGNVLWNKQYKPQGTDTLFNNVYDYLNSPQLLAP